MLQRNLDSIWDWSKNWKMEFDTTKCSVMEFGELKKNN